MKFALRRWPWGLAIILALLAASLVPELFREEAPVSESPPPEDPPPRTGRVTIEGGRTPVAGATVRAIGGEAEAETVTGPGGDFHFEPAPEGVREVFVRYGPLTAREPWRSSGLEVRLPAEFKVGGRVVDATDGDAVVGARIEVGSRTGVSGERGGFRFEAVPFPGGGLPGIRVSAEGFEDAELNPGLEEAWDDLFIRLVRK